ncbi:glycosyl hydrolase [Massilia sp. Root351]|nr:glycosyl hydrolase [Massilia sp. Root351]
MKLLYALVSSFAIACLSVSPAALAIGQKKFVDSGPAAGVELIARGKMASIHLDGDDYPGVLRAARDLQSDIEKVGSQRPSLSLQKTPGAVSGQDVILIGTIGHSRLIDQLIAQKKLDTSSIKDLWEGYVVQAVKAPMPGVARALVIAGSDKRGTIFGIYTLAEQLGVSPWYWWADVPVPRKDRAVVPFGTLVSDRPAVKYRGIFLNDEAPALTNWAKDKFGGFNHQFYEKLFELMLRMRANYLWPAMWYSAFNDDDKENARLANEMGIVMGTSHHEPMMRSQQEWHRYGKGPWDYEKNGDALRKFWAEGLRNSHDYEQVITMAMRGDGDEPMSEQANVSLLQGIVNDQRKLIAAEWNKDPAQVPQLWALYKEVQEYYDKGMRVPDDVLLLMCDDNWGNIRRLPTAEERKRSGGAGIYYHFDYVGVPRSYKWLNVTQIAKVWEQMNLASDFGADRMWVVNVGDLKPMEIPTEFFLTYAWDPKAWPAERLGGYLNQWAAREFGAVHAGDIADIVNQYTRFNARRRPEQLDPATYSLVNYREAERVVSAYNGLAERARRVAAALPAQQRDAFFQLVEYPVRASANALDMYVSAGMNRLYANQGRITANDMAAKVRALFANDAELARKYQQDISGGKWKHMMSQTRFGYTNWDQPYRDVMPAVSELRAPVNGELAAPNGIHPSDQMGIAVEGNAVSWPVFPIKPLVLPQLDVFQKQAGRIELFNRSSAPFSFSISANQPWVRLSTSGGTVEKTQLVEVDVQWDQVPLGDSRAELTVTGPDKASVKVAVPVHNPAALRPEQATGHVEAHGVIAIEAEHYTAAPSAPGRRWLKIPDYGHTLSGMTVSPAQAGALELRDGMQLQYTVNIFNPGKLQVEAVLAPTLKFSPGGGFRYGISFDDEAPQVINIHADESEEQWRKIVSDGVARFSSTHMVRSAGKHTLKFWALDPGVVLQRLVVNTGGLKPSYLGPPESPYFPARGTAR